MEGRKVEHLGKDRATSDRTRLGRIPNCGYAQRLEYRFKGFGPLALGIATVLEGFRTVDGAVQQQSLTGRESFWRFVGGQLISEPYGQTFIKFQVIAGSTGQEL